MRKYRSYSLYFLKVLLWLMIVLALLALITGINLGEFIVIALILPTVIFFIWKFDEFFWFELNSNIEWEEDER